MNNKLAVALVCLGFAVCAKAEVNFDQGIDVKSVINDAAAIDIKIPGRGDDGSGHYRPSPHHISYSRDCRIFNFGSSGDAAISGRAFLTSTEWVEECHHVPDHPPMPGPGRHAADEAAAKGMECHQRPGEIIRRTAQLSIAQRKLFPWETESFEVCLEGPRMDFYIRRQAYSYGINSVGYYDVQYRLAPKYKVPMAPDREGLAAGEFGNSGGRFNFKVSDKWSAEYAGEKTVVKVELYKDGFRFFDSYKGKKEFTFDAAAGYEMSFAENELDASKSFGIDEDPSKTFTPAGEATRGASKYYLRWGFRRVGRISTNGFVDKGSTGKIEVK